MSFTAREKELVNQFGSLPCHAKTKDITTSSDAYTCQPSMGLKGHHHSRHTISMDNILTIFDFLLNAHSRRPVRSNAYVVSHNFII